MAQGPPQPPPTPDAGPDSIVLDKFTGIKNVVTPERLKGEDFQSAINVDLDDVGQLHRRRGVTLVSSGAYNSLFTSDSGVVYGVRNGELGIINPDYSFINLFSGIGPTNLCYVQVGGVVYFSSATNSGQIAVDSNVVSPWGVQLGGGGGDGTWISPVVNPVPTLPPIHGKLLGPPPMATYLTYFNGRIYMAQGATLWCTELFLYNYVDQTRTYMTFENDITGLGTVTDGIYVGTQTDIWFLSGPKLDEFKRASVMSQGVIPGSMLSMPGELADPHNMDQPVQAKDAVMYLTASGLCLGFDSGATFNLTQNRVLFPKATTAAPLYRRMDGINSYVAVLDSQGTPADNARIGDYIDATIIRFKG